MAKTWLFYLAPLMESAAVTFGRRVRALRTAKGMTQEQLGHAAHLDYKHLSAIERGSKSPSFDAIDKLAKALDVEFWQLFTSEKHPMAPLEQDLAGVVKRGGDFEPDDLDEFFKGLRAAVRRLDRRGSK